MTATGYRPTSHPVLRRQAFRVAMELGLEHTPSTTSVAATVVSDTSYRIEDLAQRVVQLPDVPMTGQQRRSLIVIANELIRRASGPTLNERS